ncbi:excinuclease [Vibrio parahaemolyticus]|nr:excinuclease [Vibrio parahaemolyticus]ELA8093883.1 excinuclease [Vibrio parahaemolyticus]ELS9504894.1 excinuclease [Vibrio parahaemolyticus]MBM4801185.1 excinuclease [Vibrio parahaemolyticus]MBM4964354.1 excinuclease [Vibrio parahaemolyticus]
MKNIVILTLSSLVFFSSYTFARDDIGAYPIENALSSEAAKNKLGTDVKFYFGEQKFPNVEAEFGEFKTNKKTNAFNKTDEEACNWVFLSAMIALKERAIKEGGNAVVDIKSNYKNNLTSSSDTFQCGAGTMIAGVALTGKVVKLK